MNAEQDAPSIQPAPWRVYTSARPALAALFNPITACSLLLSAKHVIVQLAVRDLAARYKGNLLGVLWVVGQPLLALAVFSFVFGGILGVRWPLSPDGHTISLTSTPHPHPQAEAALLMFCGIVLYSFFSDAANSATHQVLWKPGFVRRAVFPLHALAPAHVGSWFVVLCFGIAVVVIAAAIIRSSISLTIIALPVVLLPLVLFTLAATWTLSAIGVFVRDIRYVVAALTQLLFFTTPICYPIEQAPARYRALIELNPLTPIIDGGRRVIIQGLWPDFTSLLLLGIVSLVAAQCAFAFFQRSKRGFGDVM